MKDNACLDHALDCAAPPDACTNDIREEKLIERQQKNDGRSFIERIIARDRNLLIACAVLILLMNWSTGRYLLYPFKIFSTWIHEMCHGMAAKLMGGKLYRLKIMSNGSGLAYTSTSGTWRGGFVSSAGYPGTAVTGCIMLLFRRTTLGPTIGTIGLGFCMIVSCLLYVDNTWGFWFLLAEGIFLLLCGWRMPAVLLDNLYNFLAATCCLNAADSIDDLYMFDEDSSTDAHSVARKWGGDYRAWATFWLCLSYVMTAIGIICAFDARENNMFKHKNNDGKIGTVDATNETANNSNTCTYHTTNNQTATASVPVDRLAPMRGCTAYSPPPVHAAQIV